MVDVANVAMRHGGGKVFSTRGVLLAVQFWRDRGHFVLGFAPDYYLDAEAVAKRRAAAGMGLYDARHKMPDDVGALRSLLADGALVATPSRDYDDSYAIAAARSAGPPGFGYVMSNDRFYDAGLRAGRSGAERAETLAWVRRHCISFAWRKDELLPNPDFVFAPVSAQPPPG